MATRHTLHDLHNPPASAVNRESTLLVTREGRPAHRGLRGVLIGMEAFLGATAVWGAIWVVPTIPQDWLRKGLITPFSDTTIPALALGALCGGSTLAAIVGLVVRPRLGALLAIISGMMIVGFELVEVLVVGFTPVMYPTQPPAWLQPFYILLGTGIALLGARLWRVETGSYRIDLHAA